MNRNELSVLSQQRRLQPVLAVERQSHVVALDAEQALVDRALFVAAHRDGLAILDADLDAAAGSAEAAGRFAPLQIGRLHALREGLAGEPIHLLFAFAAERDHRRSGDAHAPEELSSIISFRHAQSPSRMLLRVASPS